MRRQKGYVLLMALLVLCLAITILSGLTRYCLNAALNANTASTNLQERWGTFCIKNALPTIGKYSPAATCDLKLGRIEYRITFQNENAKLNLNQLFKWYGQQTLTKACQELSGEYNLVLTPNDYSENRRIREPFERWGQVFDLSVVSGNENYHQWLTSRTNHITLWGNGKLSWQEADERTLRFLLQQILSPAETGSLLEARKKKRRLSDAIMEVDAVSERSELERFVADDANCLRAEIDVLDGSSQISRYSFVDREFGSDLWISW